jgi:endonuclease YncB( thermonuclease family)
MIGGLGWILALGALGAAPLRWDTLENCRFVQGRHSDGDSIEAEVNGRRYIFRLYFVDTLEKNPFSAERRLAQARSFGIKGAEAEETALRLANAASIFTRSQLARPFAVTTRWEKVDSRKGNPSLRAFVTTAEGNDLAGELVSRGLAIIRSGRRSTADHPSGPSADEILRDLRRRETEAHRAGRGAWASAALTPKAAPLKGKLLRPLDRDDLIALAGQRVRVRGRVGRIGALADGRITFFNFEGSARGDFVLIARADAVAALNRRFPQGVGQALVGREIVVKGTITLFREAPQIEIEDPAQIVFVGDR